MPDTTHIIHSYKEYPNNLTELFNKFIKVFEKYENYVITEAVEMLSDGKISVTEIGPRIGLSTQFKYSIFKFSVKFDIIKDTLNIHFFGNKVALRQFKDPIVRCINKAMNLLNQHLEFLEEENGPKITCLVCGGEISANSRFCPECGAHTVIKQYCPVCGVQLPRYCKFCQECGTKID